jgi:hypothetical protein
MSHNGLKIEIVAHHQATETLSHRQTFATDVIARAA